MTVRVSPRLDNIPRYTPGMSTAEALARFGVTDAVKLSSNESPYGLLPGVRGVIEAGVDGLNRYPDGPAGALRARIADLHGVDSSRVVLGNGSGEIILMAGQALMDPGTTVIYPDPSFALYPHVAQASGGEGIAVPLLPDGTNDLESMAAYVDERTRLIILCTPNNPTGAYVSAARIERLLDEVPSDVAVLVDEAYYDFVTEVDRGRVMSMARERPNLLVTRTFSKAYGLSGLRVGYAIGAPELVDAIDRVRPPFNVNSLAQAAALQALSGLTELDARVRETVSERQRVQAALADAGVPFTPSQANFILVGPISTGTDAAPVHEQLLRHGVIVRDGAALGAPGCVRVTVGSPPENDRFLAAMDAVAGGGDRTDNSHSATPAGTEGRQPR